MAWRAGFIALLAGLGDPCPYGTSTVDAIDWRDGHAVALQLLRELPED
jgi:hypothetical protein